MDEREDRFAKRRVGVGSYSGSSEMEQRVQYWGGTTATNNVHPRTKKKKNKRLSSESNEKEDGMLDITDKFYQQLARTELFYTVAKEIFDKTDFTVPGNEYIEKLRFFANSIGYKKLFDIKQPGKGFSEDEIGLYSTFEGSEYHFTAYGNINYGYAAKIFGFALNVALKAAGLNQVFGNGEGEPNWGNLEGLFDEYTDSDMIKKGYNISLPWD